MFTPIHRPMLGSASYLATLQQHALVVYYPLTDTSISTTAGSLSETGGGSDETFDKENGAGDVTEGQAQIFKGEPSSMQMNDRPATVHGRWAPADWDDWTWIFWMISNSVSQDGIEACKLGGNALTITVDATRAALWTFGETVVNCSSEVGTIASAVAYAGTTTLGMYAVTCTKDGATYDYRAYLNGAQLGSGVLNAAKLSEIPDEFNLGRTRITINNGTKYAGASFHASAAGGGGAISSSDLLSIYNKWNL